LTLDEIPSGRRVFADATVFVYHFAGVSQACRRFLERCESGELKALTSTAALVEVSHRLMMMEAVSRGLVSRGNVAKKLRKKPNVVKKLSTYDENVQRIPLMGVEVVPLDLKTLSRASELRGEFGLMMNDSLMASTALEAGLELIATADQDFQRVRELSLAVPDDLEGSSG
jgi:predicted nucleic acid-binding protein